jgi:hypothetical protein
LGVVSSVLVVLVCHEILNSLRFGSWADAGEGTWVDALLDTLVEAWVGAWHGVWLTLTLPDSRALAEFQNSERMPRLTTCNPTVAFTLS